MCVYAWAGSRIHVFRVYFDGQNELNEDLNVKCVIVKCANVKRAQSNSRKFADAVLVEIIKKNVISERKIHILSDQNGCDSGMCSVLVYCGG